MQSYFVKKWVSHREYDSWYSKLSGYCWLERGGSEIAVGFATTIPPDGQILFNLSQSELEKIDAYYRANHISPTPLPDKPKEIIQQSLNENPTKSANEINVQEMFI